MERTGSHTGIGSHFLTCTTGKSKARQNHQKRDLLRVISFTMNLVCTLLTGEISLIELQAVPSSCDDEGTVRNCHLWLLENVVRLETLWKSYMAIPTRLPHPTPTLICTRFRLEKWDFRSTSRRHRVRIGSKTCLGRDSGVVEDGGACPARVAL